MSEPRQVRVKEKPLEETPREAAALARLAIGTTILASRKLAELLASWTEMTADELTDREDDDEAVSLRHILIGTAVAVSGAIKGVLEVAGPILDSFFEPGPSEKLPGPVRSIMQDLAELGADEEARSVAYAQTAFSDAVDRVFKALSQSPELAELILEQTAGLGRDAVNELRDVAWRADRLSESAVRRLTRRSPGDSDA